MTLKYFSGLDLGQAADYTSLVVLEQFTPDEKVTGVRVVEPQPPSDVPVTLIPSVPEKPVDRRKKPAQKAVVSSKEYRVRHMERFPLNTPYPAMVDRVVALFSEEPLSGSVLTIDRTGVGRPVVDYFTRAKPRAVVRPILITGGSAIAVDGPGWRVPKKELVSVLQVVLQTRRLKMSKQLPEARALERELETFRVKVTVSANETYEAWREHDHDDLVLALAMAVWVAERGVQQFWMR